AAPGPPRAGPCAEAAAPPAAKGGSRAGHGEAAGTAMRPARRGPGERGRRGDRGGAGGPATLPRHLPVPSCCRSVSMLSGMLVPPAPPSPSCPSIQRLLPLRLCPALPLPLHLERDARSPCSSSAPPTSIQPLLQPLHPSILPFPCSPSHPCSFTLAVPSILTPSAGGPSGRVPGGSGGCRAPRQDQARVGGPCSGPSGTRDGWAVGSPKEPPWFREGLSSPAPHLSTPWQGCEPGALLAVPWNKWDGTGGTGRWDRVGPLPAPAKVGPPAPAAAPAPGCLIQGAHGGMSSLAGRAHGDGLLQLPASPGSGVWGHARGLGLLCGVRAPRCPGTGMQRPWEGAGSLEMLGDAGAAVPRAASTGLSGALCCPPSLNWGGRILKQCSAPSPPSHSSCDWAPLETLVPHTLGTLGGHSWCCHPCATLGELEQGLSTGDSLCPSFHTPELHCGALGTLPGSRCPLWVGTEVWQRKGARGVSDPLPTACSCATLLPFTPQCIPGVGAELRDGTAWDRVAGSERGDSTAAAPFGHSRCHHDLAGPMTALQSCSRCPGGLGGSLPSEPPRQPRQQLRCRWPRSAIWPQRAAGKNSQGKGVPRAASPAPGRGCISGGGPEPGQRLRGKMPEQSNDYRVVVFGAGGVGKSSLVLRFVKGTFRDTYIPTIEDTYRQVISCDKSVCTLQITDTTGSHQFPAMQRLSISKGHAFILVFSVTSKQSLEELKPIYQQIVQIKGSVESIPIMLVGNKCDETQREVESREGEAMAKEWKCAFMETSAKMNYNVKELFQELLNLEKRRNVSLTIDGKRSSKQKRTDKIKGKCPPPLLPTTAGRGSGIAAGQSPRPPCAITVTVRGRQRSARERGDTRPPPGTAGPGTRRRDSRTTPPALSTTGAAGPGPRRSSREGRTVPRGGGGVTPGDSPARPGPPAPLSPRHSALLLRAETRGGGSPCAVPVSPCPVPPGPSAPSWCHHPPSQTPSPVLVPRLPQPRVLPQPPEPPARHRGPPAPSFPTPAPRAPRAPPAPRRCRSRSRQHKHKSIGTILASSGGRPPAPQPAGPPAPPCAPSPAMPRCPAGGQRHPVLRVPPRGGLAPHPRDPPTPPSSGAAPLAPPWPERGPRAVTSPSSPRSGPAPSPRRHRGVPEGVSPRGCPRGGVPEGPPQLPAPPGFLHEDLSAQGTSRPRPGGRPRRGSRAGER
ncbi:hypothetical protein DV515_00017949, partial [Chloebia gouldiae]